MEWPSQFCASPPKSSSASIRLWLRYRVSVPDVLEDAPNVRRRYFSPAEVTAAWLAQGRICKHCTRSIDRDQGEGDHIIAFVRGGLTEMVNLQVLCGPCNRRKGTRENAPEWARPNVVVSEGLLSRSWQVEAARVAVDTPGDVLIEACPGAGKTRMALAVAARMFHSGQITRVLIFVPTARLVGQWVEGAGGSAGGPSLPLAPAGWAPSMPLYSQWVGAVATYQSLYANATMFQFLAAEAGHRTLVIFDEVHHVGTDSSWGLAAQEAFARSTAKVLSLSGTPFRTRDPIAFVNTVEGRSVPDYTYRYGEAIDDGACRPVRFAQVGGRAVFEALDGSVLDVTFDDELEPAEARRRLRTVLEVGGHLETMIRFADLQLQALRSRGDTDAAGLVIAIDIDHAEHVAGILQRVLGVRPVVVCSRTSDPGDMPAAEALEHFVESHSPWMVAVKMVSEGVDIPRLRAVVYATNVRTELTFRQIVGRVVRVDPRNEEDYGIVVLPSDPTLLAYSERIHLEAPGRVIAPVLIEDEPAEGGSRAWSGRSEFFPIDSEGAIDMVSCPQSGRRAPAEMVALARAYIVSAGSPLDPFELALMASTDAVLAAAMAQAVQ
jgi:superfamily II DNA or RNA helicase